MLEVITGVVLAASAGLNAYIPMLGLGLLSRFTDLVELPGGWAWLENGWCMGILGVLLLVEVLVDKFPALDSVNDILQTVVRPASGGMVFAAGAASDTVAVSDPAAFVQSGQVWPIVVGVVVALIPHALKSFARPVLNVLTGGAAAPVTSAAEDAGSVALVILAVVVPVVALLLLIGIIIFLIVRLRRALAARRARRGEQAAANVTPAAS
ncbi:DUF4126 domain-containing protein [Leucobacter sp. CSA2]|uniref:DUF4126 domain-containing protein n=1 Tax=Leucobacter edaphi TaxID=2796472 RepID=A0A934QDX7_9MICO|nr:DUF4126 domain-containing protein [Leucobacter edaphi]MBK0421464.1 DUF4126 domain-containing protein [Leucobacter edaphi]